ncbi:hypothetical protein H4R19_005334, partial [Coemansia spiralis]
GDGMPRGARARGKRRSADSSTTDWSTVSAQRRRVDGPAAFPWPSESPETPPPLEQLAVSDSSSPKSGPSSEPRRSGRRRVQRVQLVGPHLVPAETTPSPVAPRRQSRRNTPVSDPVPAQERGTGPRFRRTRRVTSSSEGSSVAGTPSVESGLSCEVTIFTQGTSVPHGRINADGEAATCPFCNKVLAGTDEEINTHANECLDNGSGSGGRMESYVFDGEERVRVTALFSGSLSAHFGTSSVEQAGDEDIDVDQQDESSYGAPQYTDADLAISETGRARTYNTSHLRTDADPQAEYEPEPPTHTAAPAPTPAAGAAAPPSLAPSTSNLVVDALKARIREQDLMLQSAFSCMVCQGPYQAPCVSIQCWHVLCEQCWMTALGTKKLCPHCQQITQPVDLRRIYL